jgi:hypothetical protein
MDDQRTDRKGGTNRVENIDEVRAVISALHTVGWFGLINGLAILIYAARPERPLNYLFGAALILLSAYMHYRGLLLRRKLRNENRRENSFPTT